MFSIELEIFSSLILEEGWIQDVDQRLLVLIRRACSGRGDFAGLSLKKQAGWTKLVNDLNIYIESLRMPHIKPKSFSEVVNRIDKIKGLYQKAPTAWALKDLATSVFFTLNFSVTREMKVIAALPGPDDAVLSVLRQCWEICNSLKIVEPTKTAILSSISDAEKLLLISAPVASRAEVVKMLKDKYKIR